MDCVGVSSNVKNPAVGIDDIDQMTRLLKHDIDAKITPPLDLVIDVQESENKRLLRIQVPRGDQSPYAIDGSKIYVRDERETNLAVRDEIVELVLRSHAARAETPVAVQVTDSLATQPPRTGVEIVEVVERKGTRYYTMSDLRKGNRVQNVTKASARRLWRYAITEAEQAASRSPAVEWQGEIGVAKAYKQSGQQRYDLAQRRSDGSMRIYYGVSEDGLHEAWKTLVGLRDD